MRRDEDSRAQKWGRRLLALLLGIVATAALPPIELPPALLIAFSGLLLVSRRVRRVGQAFWLGWWFGLGHLASGLYWIANAFTIDSERFAWLIPFASLGLPAMLAIYSGLALALVTLLRVEGVGRVLAFAVAWTGLEWLRGLLFTGFPWNLAASTWVAVPEILQALSVIGAWGVTLLTVLVAGLPAALGHRYARRSIAAGIALVALAWGYGYWRLAEASTATVPGVRLRLVQASVPQQLKWQAEQRVATLAKHLAMTRTESPVEPTLVIWPETAIPFLVEAEPDVLKAMAAAAPPGGAIVTGTIRLRGTGDPPEVTNGLVAIDEGGRVIAAYDKAHLVPFGEYTPAPWLFGWFPALGVGMVPGPGRRNIALPGVPAASALICYEVIFPGAVIDRDDRPQWLLNLTNDAWYGRSAGPYQHFAAARMRAVEEGLPLVRSAQNGISGVIDAYGRATGRLELDDVGAVDSALPAALPPTVYSRWRESPAAALALIIVTLGLLLDHRRKSGGN
ncbi:MAG: apolipoprotein N-acyltransferase [Alphaproteobacteria bacterium]|nr:apolipoprotein N-acyltransferase [Alphaproteobacteria bacterium]